MNCPSGEMLSSEPYLNRRSRLVRCYLVSMGRGHGRWWWKMGVSGAAGQDVAANTASYSKGYERSPW